jgi:hypothetical protein
MRLGCPTAKPRHSIARSAQRNQRGTYVVLPLRTFAEVAKLASILLPEERGTAARRIFVRETIR